MSDLQSVCIFPCAQMQSFKEQIVQIDSDLKNGLKLMEKANNSGETVG